MTYRPTREENEDVIWMLADRYPKCFFADPRMRRPLKKNIVADLQQDGFPVAYELMTAAVGWYQTHFGYQHSIEAGAKRINLNGEEVGTVTELEQLAAQKKIKDGKAVLTERKNATQTLQTLHANGRISDDHLKKLDAPTMKEKAMTPSPNGADLTPLRAMWTNIDTVLSTTENAGLRSALTAAALKVFVTEATKLIATLENRNE